MKIQFTLPLIAVCAAGLCVSGCNKEEATAPAADTSKPAQAPAAEPAKPVEATQPAAQPAAQPPAAQAAAKDVADQAGTQAKAADQQAQGLIDKAKSYIADQKYQDALTTLNQLTGSKLTDEEQKLVDSLKAQIQSALAGAATKDAASALGGALGGKK